VTKAMIGAGVAELSREALQTEYREALKMIEAIYRAMRRVRTNT
jgi:hypothetical protein